MDYKSFVKRSEAITKKLQGENPEYTSVKEGQRRGRISTSLKARSYDKPGHAGAKSEALKSKVEVAKKMVRKPTGGTMREGSRMHQYWEDIKRRGKEDRKYGAGD